MSNINGVKIEKKSGNLNQGPQGEDRIVGLIAGVETAPSSLAFATTAEINRLADAEDLGINEAYDDTNNELLYQNIKEYFRLYPDGKIWIRLVESTTAALVAPSAILTVANDHANKLLLDAEGEIRVLAVMTNNSHLAGTYTDGLPTEVEAAISQAQIFANWAYDNFMPVNVILEGCDFQTPISAAADLRDMSANYPNVSIMIGQDKAIADDRTEWSKRAAMGTILGMISRRDVATSIGFVGDGNLTDAVEGIFTSACLTDGTAIEDYQGDWQALDDKGYIFIKPYIGYSGYYFNDDHTAAAKTEDEHFISLGRVKNKCARVLRQAYLPFVKSKQLVEAGTGKLPQSTLKYLETVGNRALDTNLTNEEEISGRKVVVDPDSDLLNDPQTLKVSFGVVPAGKIGEIEGTLQFITSTE